MTIEPHPIPSSGCWYADCVVRIPMEEEFYPIGGDRYIKRWTVNQKALLAHLTNDHRPRPRLRNPFRRIFT